MKTFENFINQNLSEGNKITLKRQYTERYPAMTTGKNAAVRNRMIEAIRDGKVTQDEFNTILKEYSKDSGKWLRRNSKFFNVSEEGISLSKFGKRVLSQITVNEEDLTKEGRAFVAAAKKAKDEGKEEFEWEGKSYPVTIEEGNAFIYAAAKAKREGKKEFEFNGKTYKVTLKADTNLKENKNINMKTQFVHESFSSFVESLSNLTENANSSAYVKAGKLDYNDQFLGRQSLSKTLALDLGLNPKDEFKGPWIGFDHVSLYATGPKGGTILDDALTGKYTYDELKAAAADFLGIK
jgi:flagellar hook-associated protein FlgK